MAERLSGKVAVIAGGTGSVGEGIVRGFLEAGATVIVPARTQEKAQALKELLGPVATERFVTIQGTFSSEEEGARLREQVLSRCQRVDAVVAAVNGQNELAPLLETPTEAMRKVLEENLLSHYIVMRSFLPVLVKQGFGSYTLVGGAAAELPNPRFGPMCVAAAAQLMMARVLAEEVKRSGVRLNEVVLGMVNTRNSASRAQPSWITADEVGSYLAQLASDESSMVKGNVLRLYEGR